MEERTQSFDEKLTLLLEEAKKKKNVLENREILDFLQINPTLYELLGQKK